MTQAIAPCAVRVSMMARMELSAPAVCASKTKREMTMRLWLEIQEKSLPTKGIQLTASAIQRVNQLGFMGGAEVNGRFVSHETVFSPSRQSIAQTASNVAPDAGPARLPFPMKLIRHTDADYAAQIATLDRRAEASEHVRSVVAEVIAAVRARGDEALIGYAAKFDGLPVA